MTCLGKTPSPALSVCSGDLHPLFSGEQSWALFASRASEAFFECREIPVGNCSSTAFIFIFLTEKKTETEKGGDCILITMKSSKFQMAKNKFSGENKPKAFLPSAW